MIEKLIIGTVQFGLNYGITNKIGKIEEEELDKIFNFCNDNNIFYFDTAQDYGNCEEILSQYSNKYPKFKIITKSKFMHKDIDNTLKISLDRFNKIEYFMLHSFEDFKNKELVNKLIYLKNKKKIKKIGVSLYNVEEAIEVLKNKNIDVIQIPFNYLDEQWFNSIFQNLLKKNNTEIHVRSIFLQGLLLNKPVKYPKNIPEKEFEYLENIIERIINKLNITKLELCFAYINSFDWINKFLIGIDNFEHLKLNFNTINKNLKLTKEDIIFIQSITQNINQDIINPSKWLFN